MNNQPLASTPLDARLDTDRLLFEGVDTSPPQGPLFSPSEVAKVFFARTSYWVRDRERKNLFVLDGEPVATTRGPGGYRQYTLADIELMAHALASHGAISMSQLKQTLLMLKIRAEMGGLM